MTITLSPHYKHFGEVPIGQPVTQAFSISVSQDTATPLAIASSDSSFTLSGASDTGFTVAYAPSETKSQATTITIQDANGTTLATLSASGTGIKKLEVALGVGSSSGSSSLAGTTAGAFQRVRIKIPTPESYLSLGQKWDAIGLGGFNAATVKHEWLTARGEAATSTFTAQSSGQVLLQSTEDQLYLVSKENALLGANGAALLGGGGGIKIMAGYEAGPVGEQSAGDAISAPSSLSKLGGHLDKVAADWGIWDTTVAVAQTAKEMALTAFTYAKTDQKYTLASLGNAMSIAGWASNICASGVNIAGLNGADLPAIQIHGTGGVMIGNPAFTSIYGGGGLLMGSMFTQTFGFLTAGIVGLGSAGLSGLIKADVSCLKGVGITAKKDLSITAHTGSALLRGKHVLLGTQEEPSPSQIPTASATLQALDEISFTTERPGIQIIHAPGGIQIKSVKKHRIQSDEEVRLKVGGVSIVIDALGISLKNAAGSTELKIDGRQILLKKGAESIKITADKFDAKVGATKLVLNGSTGAITCTGPNYLFK